MWLDFLLDACVDVLILQ